MYFSQAGVATKICKNIKFALTAIPGFIQKYIAPLCRPRFTAVRAEVTTPRNAKLHVPNLMLFFEKESKFVQRLAVTCKVTDYVICEITWNAL